MAAAPDSRDDRVALIAVLAGAALAVAGWRDPWVLAGGVMLGAGGVALALRVRPTVPPAAPPAAPAAAARPAPRSPASPPSLLGALLSLAIVVALCRGAVGFVESFRVAQLLSEGAAMSDLAAEGRSFAIAARVLRDLGVLLAAIFLGAAARRWLAQPR